MAEKHLAGDQARVVRENLRAVHGRVALLTITGPGEVEVCPCCGRSTVVRLVTDADREAWNLGASANWRRFQDRIKREMWRRHRLRPPRVVLQVAQRQARGVDHLHRVALARTPDQLERVRVYVRIYREYHVRYGFGFIDDPERPDRKGRTRLFEKPVVAGLYLGHYLGGGQLERYLAAADTSWRAVHVSPVLQARTGFTLPRVRWLRQAYHVRQGTWRGGGGEVLGRMASRLPSWWHTPEDLAWVMKAASWDGVPG